MKQRLPPGKRMQGAMPRPSAELLPISVRPGRRLFIERCESVRFREDKPAKVTERQRIHARASYDEDRAMHLGNHLRVDSRSAPGLAATLERCAARLGLATMPEVFVFPGPGHQAYCCSVGPNDVGLLAVSGALIDLLDENELAFVICHELGHLALHGGVSRNAGSLLERVRSSVKSQSREISADRVGLLGCGDFDASKRALVKIHCGFRGVSNHIDVHALMDQAEDIEAKDNGWQALDSHPFLPVRLWALSEFHRATSPPNQSQRDRDAGVAQVDQAIARRLAMMGGGTGAIERARMLSHAQVWLGALWIHAIPHDQRAAALTIYRATCGEIESKTAIAVLDECGDDEVTVRARAAVADVLSSDSSASRELHAFIDSISAKAGVNMKATDAWVLLAEMMEGIEAE